MTQEDEIEEYGLKDALDVEIVMQRDVHFGGKFPFMIEYYQREGKGVREEFDIERIRLLEKTEKDLGQNLAALLLSGADAEKVARAKNAYEKLRQLYEEKKKESSALKQGRLIADLILSEEENPQKAIQAIVKERSALVPLLIDLIRSEDFYDPLFPGYGFAPELAAICLGEIGDKRAIISLFESIGEQDFVFEDQAIKALRLIGEPAKEFLLHVVHAKPITYDNERAAMALVYFKDMPGVPEACLAILKEIDLKHHLVLATYLILTCESLQDSALRKEFLKIAHAGSTPAALRSDFKTIEKHWQS